MENNQNEREFDWTDTIENEGHEFVVLPEGDYPFQIVALEKARHEPRPGGKLPACNQANMTVRVTTDNGSTTDIKHRLFLHSSQEWKLCEFFSGIGARKKGEPLRMNWGIVVGATGTCHVKKRAFTRKDGTEGESNEISRFYPKDTAPEYREGDF